MKQFVIVDNIQTLTGMRLAGIEGQMVDDKHPFEDIIKNKLNDKTLGVIMISPSLIEAHQDFVDDLRFNHTTPLIVEILGPDEYQNMTNSIADTIQHAIGISI